MNLPKNIIESIIVTLIVDVIILRLLFGSFLKRQKNKGKGQRYLVGIAMTFLGFVLMSIGLYLFIGWIISWGLKINIELIAMVSPFLVVGILSMVFGIFFINNP